MPLDQPLKLPSSIQQETPPSIPDHMAGIEPWVIYDLKSTIMENVHFEHQLYGPLNSFLEAIFPVRRRFMTKPQGLLRKVLEFDESEDEYMEEVSFGSTGGIHRSRNHRMLLAPIVVYLLIIPLAAGAEDEKFFPDFITVKVTPQLPGKPRQHLMVAIVEVKRNDKVSETEALKQVAKYLQRAWELPGHSENLCAYLVMGQKVHRLWMQSKGRWRADPPFSMFEAGDKFTKALCETAIHHWN